MINTKNSTNKIRKIRTDNKKINLKNIFFDSKSSAIEHLNKKDINEENYYYVVLNKNSIVINSTNFNTFKIKENKIALVYKNKALRYHRLS